MKFGHSVESTAKDRYYHLWIAAAKDQIFFETSLDKAYIVHLFHEYLSPRMQLDNGFSQHHNYSSSVDLIAYSLTDFGMNLLLSASSTRSIEDFGQSLLTRYSEFLNQQRAWEMLPFDTIFTYDNLADEHEALGISREIHLLQDNWRHDQYSSIGFYLDDRRGDWLQPWRLTNLYNNDPEWYQNFLMDEVPLEVGALEFLET